MKEYCYSFNKKNISNVSYCLCFLSNRSAKVKDVEYTSRNALAKLEKELNKALIDKHFMVNLKDLFETIRLDSNLYDIIQQISKEQIDYRPTRRAINRVLQGLHGMSKQRDKPFIMTTGKAASIDTVKLLVEEKFI